MKESVLLYPNWKITAIYWLTAVLSLLCLLWCWHFSNNWWQQIVVFIFFAYLLILTCLNRLNMSYQVIALRLSKFDRLNVQIELMLNHQPAYVPTKFFAPPLVHYLLTILPLQTVDLKKYYVIVCRLNSDADQFRHLRFFLKNNRNFSPSF